MSLKKIVFLGPPSSGKTSLRKFFFEGVPADKILETTEPPTIGIKHARYQYMYSYPVVKDGTSPEKISLDLSLMDTSGQEIDTFLASPAREQLFSNTDIVFFIFDASDWQNEKQRKRIMDFIFFTHYEQEVRSTDAIFHIIGHKYDKCRDGKDGMQQLLASIKNDLQDYVRMKTGKAPDFNVYLTSLHKEYRKETFKLFHALIAALSSIPFWDAFLISALKLLA